MKLLRFNDYIAEANTDSELSFINFNDNEIKYLKAKAVYRVMFANSKMCILINSKRVEKLSSGEYYIYNDNIVCTTTQAIIKYTQDKLDKAIFWFNNLLSKSISDTKYIKNKDTSNKYLSINGKLWLIINNDILTIHILANYFLYLTKENYYEPDFEVKSLINYLLKLNKMINVEKYLITSGTTSKLEDLAEQY